jgi:hypothetical protein
MTAKEHARLLGLFMWIFAGFQLLLVAALGIFYAVIVGFIMTAVQNAPHGPGDPPPPPPEAILGIVVVVMIFALVLVLLFSIPKLVAGYGLRKGKSWAQVWTIIACIIGIMSIPVGTAVGVYGLWFVFSDQGKAYFADPNNFEQQPNAAPPPNNWA